MTLRLCLFKGELSCSFSSLDVLSFNAAADPESYVWQIQTATRSVLEPLQAQPALTQTCILQIPWVICICALSCGCTALAFKALLLTQKHSYSVQIPSTSFFSVLQTWPSCAPVRIHFCERRWSLLPTALQGYRSPQRPEAKRLQSVVAGSYELSAPSHNV